MGGAGVGLGVGSGSSTSPFEQPYKSVIKIMKHKSAIRVAIAVAVSFLNVKKIIL